MAVKPNALPCLLLEQIIDDPVSELKIKIEQLETGGVTTTRIILHEYSGGICGQFGNRVFVFNKQGQLIATETEIQKSKRPSWLSEV